MPGCTKPISVFFTVIAFLIAYPFTSKLESSEPSYKKKTKVCIDPGFGGQDVGSASCTKGIYSKDINLQIAKKLSKRIENPKIDTVLTRNEDQTVTLEERSIFCNTQGANFLISVHTNAHVDPTVSGIETYYLNLASDDDLRTMEKLKNYENIKEGADLEEILLELASNAIFTQSQKFAEHIQYAVIEKVVRKYAKVINRGTKQAPLYILLRSHMPAILIEAGFISNPLECERLMTSDYQELLVDGIVHGLKAYLEYSGQ